MYISQFVDSFFTISQCMINENLEKGITKKYAIINNLVIFHDLHISSDHSVR